MKQIFSLSILNAHCAGPSTHSKTGSFDEIEAMPQGPGQYALDLNASCIGQQLEELVDLGAGDWDRKRLEHILIVSQTLKRLHCILRGEIAAIATGSEILDRIDY